MNNLFESRGFTFALSCFFAFLLWLYVRGEFQVTRKIQVKLNYIKTEQWVPFGPRVENINVEIRGPLEELRLLMQRNHRIDIDLKNAKGTGPVVYGNFEALLRKEFPREVEILKIQPREIKFEVDRYIKKAFPVEVKLTGEVHNGFEVRYTDFLPKKVLLAGSQRALNEISKVTVSTLDVSGAKQSIQKEIEFIPEQSDFWVLGDNKIRINIKIDEKIVQKTFDVPVSMINSDLNHSISPKNIQIIVEGPYGTIHSLGHRDFVAYVDGKNLRIGHYRRAIAIKPPSSVKLIDNQPRYFSVRLWK